MKSLYSDLESRAETDRSWRGRQLLFEEEEESRTHVLGRTIFWRSSQRAWIRREQAGRQKKSLYTSLAQLSAGDRQIIRSITVALSFAL